MDNPITAPLQDRIKQSSSVDPDSGCWNWSLSKQSNGYGQIKHEGKMKRAHRVSYLAFRGEIPVGLEVMHDCDNRSCVNPWHLTAGTHADNMASMSLRGPHGVEHKGYGRPGISGSDNKQSVAIAIEGIEYGSMKEAERVLGVSHGSARYWIKTGRAQLIRGNHHGIS